MSDDPNVSVIMPAYNAGKFIAETVESVLRQVYPSWELIIVDDASSDDTVAVVQRLASRDARIRLIQLSQNSGAAVARNTGLREARGRYIGFLDCDDLWLPEKLVVQLAWMKEHAAPFVYSAYERISTSGEGRGVVGVPSSVSYAQLLKTSVIGCSTALYDTAYFGKVLMPDIRMRQDFGLWLSLLKRVECAQGIPEVLVRYRMRSDSISSNKRRAALYTWRVYRQVEKLPLPKAIWYFSNYAVRGVLRHHFTGFAKKIGIMH